MRLKPRLLAAAAALCTQLALAAPHDFELPAQSLAQSLQALARQAGLQLLVEPTLLQGRQAAALHGRLEPAQALERLLAGSGLQGRIEGRTLVLTAASPPTGQEQLMPTVRARAAQLQDPTDPVRGYLARVSGSAAKGPLALMETPQSLSVLGAELMRDQAVTSVAEAVRYAPGVRPADYGITDDDVALRGFWLTGAGLYRDGLRFIHNGFMANLEPYGLERLELLRGPASVTYGQASPGGLLNAVTKRPQANMRQELSAELGSHSRRQLALDLGGPLNQDDAGGNALLWRLTALKRDAGTQWTGLEADRSYVAPSLSWQGERTQLTLMAQHQRDRSGFIIPYHRETAAGPAREDLNLNGPDGGHDKRSTALGYALEHELSPQLSLVQNLRYMQGRNERREMRNRGLAADGRSITRLGMVRPDSEHSLSVDTRLQARLDSGALSHRLAVGVDYYRSTLDLRIHALNAAPVPLDMLAPVYTPTNWGNNYLSDQYLARVNQLGLYLQDQIRVGPRWTLSLGGRWDEARTRTDYDFRANANAAFNRSRFERNDRALSGRAGLLYLSPEGWAPYLSWSSSFQPTLSTTTARDEQGQEFRPETGRQWEAGLRYAPAGAAWRASAALFELTKRNVRTPSKDDPRKETQTGEVRSRGLELELSGELTRGLSVQAQYTYLAAKVTRSLKEGEQGSQPPATPRHSAAAWAKYSQGPWSLGLGLRHVSAAPGDVRQPDGSQPMNEAFTLADAMLAYQWGEKDAWRLALNVSNLGDKRYRTQCNLMRGGREFCVIGYGRDMRLNLAYQW